MPSLEERFANALHGTARGWRLAVDRRLRSLGLSQAGWLTIAAVAKARVALGQSELARRLGIEDATMVAMVDRLTALGLVRRVASQRDRRVKHVVLTVAGNELYAKVRVEGDAVRRHILAGVDPATLQAATVLLEALLPVIENVA